MAAVTDSLFYVGQKFSCFNDLENCKKEYEMSNFCNLTMRDAKTLQSMMKYVPKKAARAKKELRYYSLRLCCTYGGKKFKKQGEGKRETESRKVDCGMCVRLILSDDGESLDVVEFSENHSNHIVSSEVYFHLPQQRRLNQSDLERAETLISVRANSKLVQQQGLQNHTGKCSEGETIEAKEKRLAGLRLDFMKLECDLMALDAHLYKLTRDKETAQEERDETNANYELVGQTIAELEIEIETEKDVITRVKREPDEIEDETTEGKPQKMMKMDRVWENRVVVFKSTQVMTLTLVKDLFESSGKILRIKLAKGRQHSHIEFANSESAEEALRLKSVLDVAVSNYWTLAKPAGATVETWWEE